MSVMLDYLGAAVVGAMLMLSMFGFQATTSEEATSQNLTAALQEDITATTEIIQFDFKRIGYRVQDATKVAYADTSRIVFTGDFDDNGTIDSIGYFLGKPVIFRGHNPNVKPLYRFENAAKARVIYPGATRFRLWYYDGNGLPTTIKSRIRSIKVVFSVENSIPVNGIYSGACWDRTFKPKNLR